MLRLLNLLANTNAAPTTGRRYEFHLVQLPHHAGALTIVEGVDYLLLEVGCEVHAGGFEGFQVLREASTRPPGAMESRSTPSVPVSETPSIRALLRPRRSSMTTVAPISSASAIASSSPGSRTGGSGATLPMCLATGLRRSTHAREGACEPGAFRSSSSSAATASGIFTRCNSFKESR